MSKKAHPSPLPDNELAQRQRENHKWWHEGVLIPFWTLQIILQGTMLGLGILGAVNGWIYAIVFSILMSLFSCVILILIVIEIIFFAKRRLKPSAYLSMQVAKFSLWLLVIILYVVLFAVIDRYSTGHDRTIGTLWRLILVVFTVLLYLATLIYGSVIYHRQRRERKLRRLQPAQGPYSFDPSEQSPGYTYDGLAEVEDTHPAYSKPSQHLRSPDGTLPPYEHAEMDSSDAQIHEAGGGSRRSKDRRGGGKQELEGDGMIHEMSTMKSIKSVRMSSTKELPDVPALPGSQQRPAADSVGIE